MNYNPFPAHCCFMSDSGSKQQQKRLSLLICYNMRTREVVLGLVSAALIATLCSWVTWMSISNIRQKNKIHWMRLYTNKEPECEGSVLVPVTREGRTSDLIFSEAFWNFLLARHQIEMPSLESSNHERYHSMRSKTMFIFHVITLKLADF